MSMNVVCAQAEAPAAPAPASPVAPVPALDEATVKKNVSYFLGYQNGAQVSDIPGLKAEDIDMEAYMAGSKDGITKSKPAVEEEALKPSLDAIQKKLKERMDALAMENAEKGRVYMEANKSKEGVVTTATGLQYKVIGKGGAEKYDAAKFKNPVFSVMYKGTLLDGTVFDESEAPVDFPLSVIPGFAEALKMMPVGAKWTLYIPHELAYGPQPNGPIPPNSALIFDVELKKITEGKEPAMPEGGTQLTPEQLQQLMQQQGGE